jgi:hypothetical protein
MSLPISNTYLSAKIRAWWRALQSPSLWIIVALSFTFLLRLASSNTNEAIKWTSPLWFLDPLLMLSLLIGHWLKEWFHWQPVNLSRKHAAPGFTLLVWCVGMLYELTLNESPGNMGGFHNKTLPSLILAQGFYIPFAVLSYFLIRKFHLSFRDMFLVGGIVCLYEALQYGVPGTFFSPLFFMTPLVLAYYVVVYAQMLTLPLLVVDETLLWRGNKPKLPLWRKVFYSLILGLTCWLITGLWGELMAKLFDGFKNL